MDKKKLRDYFCNCDYCSTKYLNTKTPIKRISSTSSTHTNNSNSSHNIKIKKSYSLNNIDSVVLCSKNNNCRENDKQLIYNFNHELKDRTKIHNLCYYYYNLWQSEFFKINAFEKHNERLENKIKYLESKLEKEIIQQIRISLEWRNTVTNLVDENTRLKKLIEKLENL
ncbi:unnamed protein product [Brachionus calyciflorus]|uniref:Uncharacterized protein n=1 Tax=Brachionus calyciflorus TaxID=104777 RepID=A0A813LZK9_9BILA|nr:unnamed protein product [Brachionus calyciflorus]